MNRITHRIDHYSLQIYGNDLHGAVTRWATAVIYLYSSGNHVGSAYFAREGFTAPDATCSDGMIYFHAQHEQYEKVLDLLRNEDPVYLCWEPRRDPREPNDGNAYFFSGREPAGED